MELIIEIVFLIYVIAVSAWCGYCCGKLKAMNLYDQTLVAEFYEVYKAMPEEQKKAFMEFYNDVKRRSGGAE